MAIHGPDAGSDVLDTPAAGPAAVRGSVLRGSGYALSLLLAVISVPLLVRHLGVEDFGNYVLVTSIITIVAGLTEGGLQAIGTREYAVRPPAQRDELMRNLLGVRIALSVTATALAVAFTLVAGYDEVLVLGTVLAGLGLIVQSVQNVLAVPLIAELRVGWATIADLLRSVVLVTATVGLVVAGAELLPFLAVTVPAAYAALVLTVRIVRDLTPFRPSFDTAEWVGLLRDTLTYAAAIAVSVVYFRLTIVLLSLLSTELQTGYFAASYRVLEVMLPLPALVLGVAFPILARAARDDAARLRYASGRIFEIGLIVGAGLGLVLVLAAPVVMDVIAGDEGEESVDILRLQAPALLATWIAVGTGFVLLSLRRHRALLGATLAALAVSVGLCFALIPAHGAEGAAIAAVAAEFTLAATHVAILVRAGMRPALAALPAIAAATALGGCAALLPVPALVQATLGGAAFVAVLAVLGRLPSELREVVPQKR